MQLSFDLGHSTSIARAKVADVLDVLGKAEAIAESASHAATSEGVALIVVVAETAVSLDEREGGWVAGNSHAANVLQVGRNADELFPHSLGHARGNIVDQPLALLIKRWESGLVVVSEDTELVVIQSVGENGASFAEEDSAALLQRKADLLQDECNKV